MPKFCSVCGAKIRLFPVKIKDDIICGPCGNRLPQKYYNIKEQLNVEQIKAIIKAGEDYDNSRPDMIQEALATYHEKKRRDEEPEDKYEAVRRYKQLYDDGLITEEEYERKRKELLDL